MRVEELGKISKIDEREERILGTWEYDSGSGSESKIWYSL